MRPHLQRGGTPVTSWALTPEVYIGSVAPLEVPEWLRAEGIRRFCCPRPKAVSPAEGPGLGDRSAALEVRCLTAKALDGPGEGLFYGEIIGGCEA